MLSLDTHTHTLAALFVTTFARKLNRFPYLFSQTHSKIYLQNKDENPPTPSWFKLDETIIRTGSSINYPVKNT